MILIRHIIEKELRDIIGSRKFTVVFGSCAVLVLLAFVLGAHNYRTAVASHEAALRENLLQMEGMTDWLMVRNHRIFLPPQPVEALVTGISNDIGRTVEVFGRGELKPEGSRFSDEPIHALFQTLDLEFLMRVAFPLFAILFAYDAISGEKERGTLRLVFSNTVPRPQYLLGKVVGPYIALAGPLMLAMLIGCMLLPVMGVSLSGGEWLRLGLIAGTGLLYLVVFLTLSVLVSALTHRSASSFVILFSVWIGTVMIMPRASVMLAGRAVTVPTLDEQMTRINRFTAELWAEDRALMSKFQPTARAPEQIMQEVHKFMGGLSDAREEKMRALSQQLNQERLNRQDEQRRIALGFARLSPAASFTIAATTLAGTAPELTAYFQGEAQAYQKQYAAFIKEKTGMIPGGRDMFYSRIIDDGVVPKPIDPHELPAFRFNPVTTSDALTASLPDLGLLALFALIFFLGAHLAFLRYDLR